MSDRPDGAAEGRTLPEWLHHRVTAWYDEVPIWKAFLGSLAAMIVPMMVVTTLVMQAMIVWGVEDAQVLRVTNWLIIGSFVVGHYWVLHLVRSTYWKITTNVDEYLEGESDAA